MGFETSVAKFRTRRRRQHVTLAGTVNRNRQPEPSTGTVNNDAKRRQRHGK
jgi:hypothetical protein